MRYALFALKAFVFTGGQGPARPMFGSLFEPGDLVIGADSGVDLARSLGYTPQLIVGDFDSVSNPAFREWYPEAEVRAFDRDKDETDTEIALRIALERGAEQTILVGGGGGRLDHLLGIVELFERPSHPDLWLTHNAVVRAFDSECRESGAIGDIISFMPLGCKPCSMSSSGLRWELDGLVWRRGSIGISNEFAAREVRVTMRSGRLLMIRPVGDA